jgi:hypothetical protein
LELTATLANDDETLFADRFVENLVHKILIDLISKSVMIYKTNGSLVEEGSNESSEQQMTKYKTFAA